MLITWDLFIFHKFLYTVYILICVRSVLFKLNMPKSFLLRRSPEDARLKDGNDKSISDYEGEYFFLISLYNCIPCLTKFIPFCTVNASLFDGYSPCISISNTLRPCEYSLRREGMVKWVFVFICLYISFNYIISLVGICLLMKRVTWSLTMLYENNKRR